MHQVEIVNLALGKLGGRIIASLEESSVEAKEAKAAWGPSRDLLLEQRSWTFAKTRRKLNPAATPPAFGWENQYLIPSDVLAVIQCVDDSGESIDWQVEGAYVVANWSGALNAILKVQVEDAGLWSVAFRYAMAMRIAYEIAIPVTGKPELQKACWSLYENALKEAVTSDGMQGRAELIRGPRLSRVR